MSAAPSRREGPLAAALASLLLLSSAPATRATESTESYGARRTVYYQDAACRLESFREYAYHARSMEIDHTSREVGFGECYARGSTGAITTCNPEDGTSTVETYLDTACQQHLYSSKESPECENLRVDGTSCPAGGPASATSDCTNMSPYPSITPGTFNLVGSPYTDRMCEHRAGGDHIVSGEAFGVGNRQCTLSTLVRGPLFSLSECMDDGTVYGKVFGPEDINCSGELHLEVLMFPRAAQTDMTGGICALGVFEDGSREYYRLKACTTNAETPKEPINVTPAPTEHANMIFFDDDQTNGQPAPVDYRGDGDDEDLRDGSDDDDGTSSYRDSGDGSGKHKDPEAGEGRDSKDHSSSEGKTSDDDSGDDGGIDLSGDDKEHHPHGKDDDDCGDEDSDDSITGSMAHGWRSDDSSDGDGNRHHHHHRDDDSASGDDASGDDYHHHASGDDDHHASHHDGDGTDDDDVHSSHEDGSGLGDGDSHEGGGSSSDDGDGDSSSDDGDGEGDSGDRTDPDDDDFDANAAGQGGDVDGDGDDGLSGDGIFAIVFGVAVSFAICLLSFVLATAGDNRQKVGPKN